MTRVGAHSCVVVGLVVTVLAYSAGGSLAATAGLVDDFSGAGTNGWGGGTLASNPGTGGVGGASDGYLLLSNTFSGNFGSYSQNPSYLGDWVAGGITAVTFWLNDVGAAQAFQLHLLISDGLTIWQNNVGFTPPNNSWQQYSVDVTSGANWTQLVGTSSFNAVLHNVSKVHFRHDLAPYTQSPDAIAGELGIDNVTLVVPSVPTIAAAKQAAIGTVLGVSGKKVTGAFSGFFYAEEPDRSSGVRVTWPSPVSVGDLVSVTGKTGTANGEQAIAASFVVKAANPGLLGALGMSNRSTGGTAFGFQPAVSGASGLSNVGLLIKTSGAVTQIGAGYLYVDDGSKLSDGTLTGSDPNVGIRIVCNPTGFLAGDFLEVTGLSSVFTTPSAQIARQILTRGSGDVKKP